MLMAVGRYPSEYDWRYMTVSRLLSPRSDPAGHLWASGGIMLCGLCALCWATVLDQRQHRHGRGDRPSGISALKLGIFCMACSAVPSQWLLRFPKSHEILVLLAFASLCLGIVLLTFQTIERTLLRRMQSSTNRPRFYAAVLAGIAVLPILLAGLTQAYVFFELPQLHWVSLSWRTRGVPAYFSFAFWEWVMCAVFSAYIVINCHLTSLHQSRKNFTVELARPKLSDKDARPSRFDHGGTSRFSRNVSHEEHRRRTGPSDQG